MCPRRSASRHSAGMRSAGRATSIGSSVSRPLTTAVGTATKRPRRSISMPPELPGLNSASLRIHATSPRVFIWNPVMWPPVTLIVRTPSGKPKHHKLAPGRRSVVSAISIAGKVVPGGTGEPSAWDTTRTSARSSRTSARTMRPIQRVRAVSRSDSTVASCTCWPSPMNCPGTPPRSPWRV